MHKQLVRVIACSGDPHKPVNDAKEFTINDVKAGLAHDWASGWGRARGEKAIIVCSEGHKFLSPLVTINLHEPNYHAQTDPEAEIREEIAATTPRTELLDAATPLDCEQPAISTPAAAAQVMTAAFGTRAARRLRPARQDDLFNPNPQPRLTFPVEEADT